MRVVSRSPNSHTQELSASGAVSARAPGRSLFEQLPDDRFTLIVGAPRSGTTWLAKIFDSHPDVLYRHEPDADDEPSLVRRLGTEHRAVIGRLAQGATIRAVGKPPVFAKNYRGGTANLMRLGLIHALRAASHLGLLGKWLSGFTIPDMIEHGSDRIRLVIKSVRARGLPRLIATGLPGSRIVVIVRHPCGQVASMMRGVAGGEFASDHPLDDDLAGDFAARCGEVAPWDTLPPVEQFAWNWAAFLDTTLSDLHGHAAVRMIRHRDLCLRPLEEIRALFDFAGLAWNPQTEDFIRRSSSGRTTDGYYEIFKNSTEIPFLWRAILSPDDQQRIMRIAHIAGFAHLWPEDHASPSVIPATTDCM